MVKRARRDGLCAAVMSEVSGDAVRGFLACLFPCLIVAMTATCAILRRFDNSTAFRRFHARASAAAPGKTKRIVTTAAHIVAIHKLRALREFHVHCSSLTPTGEVWSSLRRTAAGEGAGSAVRRRGDVFLGACRRRRRREGLQLYQLRAAWGATGQLSDIWAVGKRFRGCRAKRLYVHQQPAAVWPCAVEGADLWRLGTLATDS